MKYTVDKNGFFGRYGGAYVPEILYKCVHDLQDAYLDILDSDEFKREYHQLLRDYVGRPSPLYYADRMSRRYGCRLYLKREDLNHTGAHKINNTIGPDTPCPPHGQDAYYRRNRCRPAWRRHSHGVCADGYAV